MPISEEQLSTKCNAEYGITFIRHYASKANKNAVLTINMDSRFIPLSVGFVGVYLTHKLALRFIRLVL